MISRGPLLLLSASLLLSVVLVRCDNTETDGSAELDEEGDSAPYAVAIELAGGGLCAGSLVAASTVLTSASCARGRPIRALTANGASRVRRAVVARGAAENVPNDSAGDWGGAMLDLAVLVLAKSPASPARPILMATEAAQCESRNTACIVTGSLAAPGERRLSLRVSDATVAEGGTCSSLARFWASVKDRALCLTGPKLCANDRGAGVVCAGKLCGVVSRSLGRAGDSAAEGCGYTHAVQSVPRWRRFLQCAHSQQGCRSEQCAELCTETELLQGVRAEDQERTSPPPVRLPSDDYDTASSLATSAPKVRPLSTELRKKAEDKIDIVTPAPATVAASSKRRLHRPRTSLSTPRRRPVPTRSHAARRQQRPRSEFEPNRPDFRAGEYGDNVVDYGENEEPAVLSLHPTHTSLTASTAASRSTKAQPTRVTAPPERLVSESVAPLPPAPPAPLSSPAPLVPRTDLYTWLAVTALFANRVYYLFSL